MSDEIIGREVVIESGQRGWVSELDSASNDYFVSLYPGQTGSDGWDEVMEAKHADHSGIVELVLPLEKVSFVDGNVPVDGFVAFDLVNEDGSVFCSTRIEEDMFNRLLVFAGVDVENASDAEVQAAFESSFRKSLDLLAAKAEAGNE